MTDGHVFFFVLFEIHISDVKNWREGENHKSQKK